MSMDRCEICDRPVDTDYDLDCYIFTTIHMKHETCVCETCRERYNIEDKTFTKEDPWRIP